MYSLNSLHIIVVGKSLTDSQYIETKVYYKLNYTQIVREQSYRCNCRSIAYIIKLLYSISLTITAYSNYSLYTLDHTLYIRIETRFRKVCRAFVKLQHRYS